MHNQSPGKSRSSFLSAHENVFQRTHLDEIPSTQDYLREHADMLLANDSLVVITANSQTKGRGTQNRKWASPPNVNIYATFGFVLDNLLKSGQTTKPS